MAKKNIITAVILFPLLLLTAQEENYNFKHISMESGLSQGTINTIFQDSKGFMWFGTEEGLNRYDGYEMKVYKNISGDSSSLSSNYVWSICEDSIGFIWIGSDGGGLNRYDPVHDVFKSYFYDENDSTSLNSNVVEPLYFDSDNNLWIGTWGGGLVRYNYTTDNFTNYPLLDGETENLYHDYIFSICEDNEGYLWIGTDGGGLFKINKQGKVINNYVNVPDNKFSLNNNIVPKILLDKQGNIWAATYGSGLNKFDPNTERFYNNTNTKFPFEEFKDEVILSLEQDSRGKIWIGTMSNGVYVYDVDSKDLTHLKNEPNNSKSISTNNIRSLYEDQSKNIWVGTLVEGINKTDIKPQIFYHIKNDPNNSKSLNNNFIFTIMEDNIGDLWIGTYGGGLNRVKLKTGNFVFYKEDPNKLGSISSNSIRSLFQDHNNDIWIGTYYGGLCKFNRKSNSFTVYKEGPGEYDLQSNMIRTIFEDSDKNLWIGTNGKGLSLFNREEEKFINYMFDSSNPDGISNNSVLSICEDADGFIWIGTYRGGLNKFNKSTNKFTHFTNTLNDTTTISSDIVTELYLSKKGELWIGTWGGGLNKFIQKSGTFISFSEDEGFASGIISGILEDDNGILWISTLKGITKFNPADYSVKNYDFSDGLQKGEFNPGAHFKSADGKMYFGGYNGINFFHPDDIYESSFQPEIVLTSFKVFNSEFKLEKSISFTNNIELSYLDNNFSFEFSSLDFTSPEKNKYAYRLEGLDKDWVETGGRRFANYTHLDPGNYVFKVKGTNHSGIWSSNVASIKIFISPPFWGTWWFRILFAAVFIAGVFSIYKKRVSSLEKEKKAQEIFSELLIKSQEKERERIASELHDSLGQNLLVIKNRALLGIKTEKFDYSHKQLSEISSAASLAIEEVRQIAYNLHPHKLRTLGLTKALKSMVNNINELTSINISMDIIDIDGIFSNDDEINIYRVVQENFNNIIKHSAAGNAGIKISKSAEQIIINIFDDGKGFDTEFIAAQTGKGFGIKNIHRRLDLLNGTVKIDSNSIYGTKIRMIIPIDNNK